MNDTSHDDASSASSGPERLHPAMAAMLRAIADKRAEDPLVGARVASQEIAHRLMQALKNERGVHVETLFTTLGALAGFACQMSIRADYAQRPDDALPFTVIETVDGRTFYFGDALNTPLAETQYSVWSLTAGMTQHLGSPVPDINEIFVHVSQTCGTPGFGVPRYPGEGRANERPVDYIKAFWPALQPNVALYCGDRFADWPVSYGLAIQQTMEWSKDAIDPGHVAKIVMECAIPMSKIDPRELGF